MSNQSHDDLMTTRPAEAGALTIEWRDAEARPSQGTLADDGEGARRLSRGEETRVLRALQAQPIRNVIMCGMISDNGLEHVKNRGVFYGSFRGGQLVGVALVGHHVLLAGARESVACFARVARLKHSSEVKVLLAEQSLADEFCLHLDPMRGGPSVRQSALQEMLSLSSVERTHGAGASLRQALPHDAEEVARLNVAAFMEMYGMNPSAHDPAGFKRRILERVERGCVWVVTDEGGIAFKAEVVSATDDAAYLEGVLTRPDMRGTGLGGGALRELCARLLSHHKTVCLLADSGNGRTRSFYRNLGFTTADSFRLVRYEAQNLSWQN
ncbi:MAG: GNAT family N-acetyltransferase [Pyrinomonadaceae bacterium]